MARRPRRTLEVSPILQHILGLQLGIGRAKLHWEVWVVLRGCAKLGKPNRITLLPLRMAIAEQQVASAVVVEVVERIAEVCVQAC